MEQLNGTDFPRNVTMFFPGTTTEVRYVGPEESFRLYQDEHGAVILPPLTQAESDAFDGWFFVTEGDKPIIRDDGNYPHTDDPNWTTFLRTWIHDGSDPWQWLRDPNPVPQPPQEI